MPPHGKGGRGQRRGLRVKAGSRAVVWLSGRAVSFDSRDLRFESSKRQTFI